MGGWIPQWSVDGSLNQLRVVWAVGFLNGLLAVVENPLRVVRAVGFLSGLLRLFESVEGSLGSWIPQWSADGSLSQLRVFLAIGFLNGLLTAV